MAYHKYFFRNRPTWDIERQFSGEASEPEEEYVPPAIMLRIPERAELALLLAFQPKGLNDDKLLQMRIRSAELMTALNYKRETAKRKQIQRRAQAGVAVKAKSPVPDPFPLLRTTTQQRKGGFHSMHKRGACLFMPGKSLPGQQISLAQKLIGARRERAHDLLAGGRLVRTADAMELFRGLAAAGVSRT